jgi:transcriptional regulator with XRE-family HTH domain
MPKTQRPNSVDISVGRTIRVRRLACEMAQTDLAKKLGVSFQQVQKYENGTNRIGAGRLQAISRILDVPISHFFNENGSTVTAGNGKNDPIELLRNARALRLLQAFSSIKNPVVENSIITLVEELGED